MTIHAPGARQEQSQRQTLTPRLQEAVRLLQLSSLDFAQEVRQAVCTNPFLEPDEAEAEAQQAQSEEANTQSEPLPLDSGEPVVDASAPDIPWESSNWSQFNQRNFHNGDVDSDIGEITPAVQSLHEHMHRDLGLLPLSDRDRVIAITLVEALDDDGYLRVTLDEVARLTEVDPAPDDDEMQVVLKLLQSLEPAGVAARDLRECLLLQLRAQAPQKNGNGHANGNGNGSVSREAHKDAAIHALAQQMVSEHLDRVAANDVTGLAREMHEKETTIEQAADLIKHLDPHPGWCYGAPGARYVTPDVIARKSRNNKWSVMLNTEIVPRVRLNRMYADLFREHRDSSHGDLAAQLQEARWTVRKVEQRFATILRVAEAIVARQQQFLELGQIAMKPLCLREIADELSLHESTVSRVTNNKYIATPAGVFELKYFFSRALPTSSGATCSTAAIRGAIKDMISAEDARSPLSDARIARLLARQGLRVARRTVTKYRQMMRVPSYELRQRLHA